MSDNNVETLKSKDPIAAIVKQAADAETKNLTEQLKKDYAEVVSAKKVLAAAIEKALGTAAKIRDAQTGKAIDLVSLANQLGVEAGE